MCFNGSIYEFIQCITVFPSNLDKIVCNKCELASGRVQYTYFSIPLVWITIKLWSRLKKNILRRKNTKMHR